MIRLQRPQSVREPRLSNTSKDRKDWVTGDEPMTGAQASYLKQRNPARRLTAAGLVRLRRVPAARLLRRPLGDLDLGAEGQGGAGYAPTCSGF